MANHIGKHENLCENETNVLDFRKYSNQLAIGTQFLSSFVFDLHQFDGAV